MMKSGVLVRSLCIMALALIISAFVQQQSASAATPYGRTSHTNIHAHVLQPRGKQTHAKTDGSQGPLVYHNGPVMKVPPTNYAIFWEPPTLPDGSASHVSATYNSLISRYFGDVGNSNVYSVTTQYYDTGGHIAMGATFGGSWVDTSSFPTPDCNSPGPSTNCLTDQDIQNEVQKAMQANGWTPGLTHMFFVFTSYGESSCFNSMFQACSFTEYCAYHSYFTDNNNQPIIYANMPYTGTSLDGCGVQGAANLSGTPNNDVDADSTINVTSHEQMEAVTDPEPDDANGAWYDDQGNEIGDKCAWTFGSTSLDGGKANVQWNNNYYIVQQEWSNDGSKCTLSYNSTPPTPSSAILVGSSNGNLYALNTSDGTQIWKAQTGGAINSSPIVNNNVVYVSSQDRYVYAFNASTGAQLWRSQVGNMLNASPVLVNSTIYTATTDNSITALNASNGARQWKLKVSGTISPYIAADSNNVYVNSNNGYTYAFNVQNLRARWANKIRPTLVTAPVINGSTIYINSQDHSIYALKTQNGAITWHYQLSNELSGGDTVNSNVLYGSNNKGAVYALTADSGQLIWYVPTGNLINTSPAIDNNMVFTGTASGFFCSINAANGSQIWQASLSGPLSSPFTNAGVVYVTAGNGSLYALNENNGTQLWQASVMASPSSSPMFAKIGGSSTKKNK